LIFNFEFWIGPATSLTQSPDAGRGRAVKDAKEYRGGMIFPRVRGTRLRVDFGLSEGGPTMLRASQTRAELRRAPGASGKLGVKGLRG